MVLVKALKYSLWCSLLFLLSCEQEELDTLQPDTLDFAPTAYFLDATLTLNDTIEPIQLFADLDPQTPEGRNEFLIVENDSTTEVYSVFYRDTARLDTNLQEQFALDDFTVLYGSASYEGVGFCFYLAPTETATTAASPALEDLLQPGQLLALGQQPGMVEIGYFKNHRSAADRPDRGLVTTIAESAPGYLKVLDVTAVQSGFGSKGFQVAVEFSAPLVHQLGLGQGGTLTGRARIFVPLL